MYKAIFLRYKPKSKKTFLWLPSDKQKNISELVNISEFE